MHCRTLITARMRAQDYAGARALLLRTFQTNPRLEGALEMLPLLEVLCCTAAGRGGVDWYNLCCCGRFRRTPGWRVPWRCSRCSRSSSAPPPAVGAWTGTDSSRCCLWMMPPGSRHATRASWPRFALLAHLTPCPPRGPCLYPWSRCPPSSPLPPCSLPSRPPLCALEILPARCAALYHETSSSPALSCPRQFSTNARRLQLAIEPSAPAPRLPSTARLHWSHLRPKSQRPSPGCLQRRWSHPRPNSPSTLPWLRRTLLARPTPPSLCQPPAKP